MTTPSKRTPVQKSQKASEKSPEPSSKPFLRFHHSEALRKKTLSVLTALEKSEDPTDHRDDLADLVVELTGCGFDSFFLEPLKAAEAGFMTQQSANLGLAGAQKVMGSVIRGIIGRMDEAQLLSVCGSIRNFMR